MLLIGGAFGVWGLHEAVTDDAAQAVEPARACLLGDLLSARTPVLDISLTCTRHASDGSATVGAQARVGLGGTVTSPGLAAPAQVPAGERSAVPAPVAAAIDVARPATVVEAIRPVTRPVVDLASPVVAEIGGTGLLKPVGDVVRPVVEPIVEALPPVLDLAQPIIGAPATPATPPAGPVVGGPPAVGAPGAAPVTNPRSTPSPVAVHPPASSWAPLARPAGAQQPAPTVADETPRRWPAEPSPAPGVTPAAPGSAAGSGSGGGTAVPADAVLGSWVPSLRPLGCPGSRCDTLAGRSRRPDPTPA
ncbi:MULTISPECIES: hypothetical protein [Micromonospora]|uniref:hypothetical protein n=1 Tax=Micromonospora TaxID=1873 RepID=UPI0011CE2840|nr:MULTISPECIES: hypothetical protein [Micromonospora]NES15208.1 hypothetical protein [Micromonospora sp. PPF5-17B]NES38126.1 hypothetical protein [Micromonospora solifontis]NES56543.1 hypothetical protein [Micromonospora sp. PPF5-6]